jgi:hypothetical protein
MKITISINYTIFLQAVEQYEDIPQRISPQEGGRQGRSAGFCHLGAEGGPPCHHSEAPYGRNSIKES